MPGDVPRKTSQTLPSIDSLLKDLSDLERCTSNALHLVRSVLDGTDSQDPTKALRRTAGFTKTPRKTNSALKPVRPTDHVVCTRNSQKIVKVCLTTLSNAYTDKSADASSQLQESESLPPSRTNKFRPGSKTESGSKHKKQPSIGIIAESCAIALDAWTVSSTALDKDRMPIIKTRYNLICRMLDLGLLTESSNQLRVVQKAICSTLRLEDGSPSLFEDSPESISHGLTYKYKEGLQEDAIVLIMNVQSCVMKYIYLLGATIEDCIVSALSDVCGPLRWCKELKNSKPKQTEIYLTNLSRYLLRFTPRVAASSQLICHVMSIQVMLELQNPDWQMALECFCRRIPAPCESDVFDQAHVLAEKFLEQHNLNPLKFKGETISVLTERMTKLAQRAGQLQATIYWSQQGITNAPKTLSLSLHLDAMSIAISSASRECLDHSINLPEDAITELNTTVEFVEPEISLLIKSMNNLRCTIINRLKSQIDDRPVLLKCLSQLLVVVRTLSNSSAMVLKADMINSTASKIIEAWTSAINFKPPVQDFATLRQGFEICLDVAEVLKLPECASSVGVMMYNNGGLLYNRQEYQAAAEILEVCFQRCALGPSEVKRLEYLWSSYLLCGNYQKAFHWLQRALHKLVAHEDLFVFRLPEEAAKTCPDVFRISSKITQLLVDHLQCCSLPTFTDLPNPNLGHLMELYLLHMSKLKPSRRINDLVRSVTEILTELYTSKDRPFERFRALINAIALFRACGDQDRVELYKGLLQNYKQWFRARSMPELALIFEARYLACSMNSSSLSLEALEGLMIRLPHFLQTISSESIAVVTSTIQAMHDLQQTLFSLDLSLDCLKISELMLHTNSVHGVLDATELLRLEVFSAEEYLRCGYDGKANVSLKRAKKIPQSKVVDPVLLSRLIQLEIKLLVGTESKHAFTTHFASLNQILEANLDSSVLLDCQAITLSCLSLYAEDNGSLGFAIQFQLEALALIRRSLHRRGRRAGGELPRTLADDLVANLAAVTLQDRNDISTEVSEALVCCLQSLAQLHEKTGALKDSLYYWEEAKNAAITFNHQRLINSVLVKASRISFKAGKAERNDLESLQLKMSQNPLQQAEACFAEAERIVSIDPNEGVKLYESARQILRSSLDTANAPTRQVAKSNSSGSRALKKKSPKLDYSATSSKDIRRYILNALCALYDIHHKQDCAAGMSSCIAELETINGTEEEESHTAYILGSSRLLEAEALLGNDPVYGALHDSALSLPSVCNVPLQVVSHHKSSRKGQTRSKPSNSNSVQIKALLNQTKHSLSSYFDRCLVHGQSYSAYKQSNLFATLSLLHSALLDPLQEIALKSSSSNYLLECSRALALSRERDRSRNEVRTGANLIMEESLTLLSRPICPSQVNFQADYIDIIPARWTVVSIGLSASGKDLVVTRMQPGKTPLILKLPMSRHSSRDIDEDTFAYEDARLEMQEIIRLSDEAAQGAKYIKDKQGKAAWWALRQELDTRLKVLLDNIEHCWLGGFKGALGVAGSDPTCSEQFRLAFAKIILKHVPLQKSRPFDLDTRILDLFTDLGPIDEATSLELLEDLLYFVLDIYQFHGESIAYDEIDIDQMVVDVQSILNSHHERLQPLHGDEHTVLVLDKSVHMFPWESLPCLRCRSVSRVPSLVILKVLLEGQSNPARISAERTNGRFVLNPGQDLISTEKSFGNLLSSLPGWSGITARKPEESEIISFLETSAIYIYFGHGGGEQYARANKIKRLSRCGVAILMGCSSGALKDQGVFDPWGTPYTYMVAACPCLVANLWDVTDKDIDRFSHEMLAHWSLLPGKKRATSICTAIAQSRDECILKYLNGAAPVTYGLPVWLTEVKEASN